MTKHEARLFADDAAVRRVGNGLLDRSLPRADWTHEAHLASCLWLLRERRDIDLPAELPAIIASYNVSVGSENSDTAGYHETITQAYIRLGGAFLVAQDRGQPLAELVNAFLISPFGHRDVLLSYYSRDRLFSVEARKRWVEPDLAPIALACAGAERRAALG